jgi:membrane protease YdiL (CAAX protease family)
MNKKYLSFLLPIRSVIFILVFVIGARLAGKEIADISNWWTVAATIINILMIGMLILTAKKCGMTYAELIKYEKGRTKIKEVVIIIIITFFVGMTGMYLAGFICYGVIPYMAPVMIEPIPKVLAIINVLLLPVTTALAEDGLYLGAGINNIKSKWAGVFVPAFFYALQHCFIPTLFDMRYIIYRFLSFLPLTVVYCWYYRKKRNPVPIMIGHAAIDVLTVVWVLATSIVPGLYEKLLQM